MDKISGSVERITFHNAENGYTVARMRPDQRKSPGRNREGLVTVVGLLPDINPGEFVRLSGKWEKHPQHGMQFSAEVCEQSLPATLEGIRLYLGSGLIKGIGPHLAERIVSRFGEGTFEIIENHPEMLSQVKDIGVKRCQQISQAWAEQKQVKEVVLFLHQYGITTNLAIKIFKTYGNDSIQVVQADPYRLARDIQGIGFKTADRIARLLGLPPDHPSRIEAGVIFALNEMTGNGHVYSPETALLERSAELLDVSGDLILPAIERLSTNERVKVDSLPGKNESSQIKDDPAVYLTPFYVSEVGVAEKLQGLARASRSRLSNLAAAIDSAGLAALAPNLSHEQRQAVLSALSNPISILTGGPGTGKTTALKALIQLLDRGRKSYALASPTGRAAKRLSEATGHPASTIHRLLEFSPGAGFLHNADNPIQVDLLVIDEVSMLDLLLANHLLKAIQPGTHVLLVGDVDQLPSVGAGDVLRDVMDSGLAKITRLTEIFRQAAGSQIIQNAHRINHGEPPEIRPTDTDFFLFPAQTADDAADWVVDVVSDRIPRKFGLNPRDQVQVLSPMYRGPAGVDNLNTRLQAVLNPPESGKFERTLFGQTFRVGDKVMQTENNYDKEVFNGDIGWISALSMEEHTLEVNFDGRRVNYEWSEADQITLAYAISIHKAQGSEFPAVVIPLVTHHYMMLQRNLLYTAVTRARQLCVIVGDTRALRIAVKNNRVNQRHTALDLRIQSG